MVCKSDFSSRYNSFEGFGDFLSSPGEYQKYQMEVFWTRPKSRCFEVALQHCFVTSEPAFRFPEVILVPFESQKRDLGVVRQIESEKRDLQV